MTKKLPCALLAVPPHAKFNHTNPTELQGQFLESPGLNHSDLWRITSYRSNLWMFTDSPFWWISTNLCLLHYILPCPVDLEMTQFPRLSLCSSPSFSLLRFSCSYSLVSSPVPYHPPPSNYISTTGHSFSINHYFFFTYTFFETTPLKMGLWIQAHAVNEFYLFLETLQTWPNWGYAAERSVIYSLNVNVELNFTPYIEPGAFYTGRYENRGIREICILRSKSQVESAWAKSWQVYLICVQVCMCLE